MRLHLLALLAILLFPAAVRCFFDEFFGGGEHHEHHHEHDQHGAQQRGGGKKAECNQYLCPQTKECVARPADCACAPGLKKCALGDWFLCVRPALDCASVARLAAWGAVAPTEQHRDSGDL